MLSNNFINSLESSISTLVDKSISILGQQSVGDGSINDCYKIDTNFEPLFLKINNAHRFPGMFEAEQSGLELLRKNSSLIIPKVILVDNFELQSFILMEFVDKGAPSLASWQSMGAQIANLHLHSHEFFGLDHNNYIGSLPQSNNQHAQWSEFFINQRLEPMIKKATDVGNWDASLNRSVDRLFKELVNIFPIESPALLHGDLWSGNFMFSVKKQASVFDPAVYYGHREMDLAMTFLFGGFDPEFYKAYNETCPLEKNWKDRIEIANLYPLLVHVILFGTSYLSAIKQSLKAFR